MFHPAERPGQTTGSSADDIDCEEPRPEDDEELEAPKQQQIETQQESARANKRKADWPEQDLHPQE